MQGWTVTLINCRQAQGQQILLRLKIDEIKIITEFNISSIFLPNNIIFGIDQRIHIPCRYK